MNTRIKTIVTAVALAATASALGSQAADQVAVSEHAQEAFPVPVSTGSERRPAQETLYQAEENRWLELERARPLGTTPTPFPPPGMTSPADGR